MRFPLEKRTVEKAQDHAGALRSKRQRAKDALALAGQRPRQHLRIEAELLRVVFEVRDQQRKRSFLRFAIRKAQQQKQFVADASHELKTPLTVILTNTELLQSPDYDEAQKQQFTDGIRTMAQQMRALVERLLELARAENARPQAAFAPVCLSEVAETSALLFEAALYERGLTLETQVEPELTVSGDERQLGQLVEILLDNARKYASGGTVRLQLQRSGRHSCHLSLENEGPALSPQQLQEIFKRFTRADPARTRSGSFGLGLAIAQAIVQAHHGKIWAESRDGRNTFHVELPLRAGREKHQETSEKGI